MKAGRSQRGSYKEVKKTGGTWYHTDVSKQQVVVQANREVLTGQEEGTGETAGQGPEQVICRDISRLEHWLHRQGDNINPSESRLIRASLGFPTREIGVTGETDTENKTGVDTRSEIHTTSKFSITTLILGTICKQTQSGKLDHKKKKKEKKRKKNFKQKSEPRKKSYMQEEMMSKDIGNHVDERKATLFL